MSMTVLATFAVMQGQGDGFGGHQGFPFAWRIWIDVIINGQVSGHYRWGALVADIVFWVVIVLVIGVVVERAVCRFGRSRSRNAA